MKARQETKLNIIVSTYHKEIAQSLTDGAKRELFDAGYDESQITVTECSGAFELPAVAAKALSLGHWNGVLCLGCIIKGETPHFDVISNSVAQCLCSLSMDQLTPLSFGLLTTNTVAEAHARAGLQSIDKNASIENNLEKKPVENKGIESARALIQSLDAFDQLERQCH